MTRELLQQALNALNSANLDLHAARHAEELLAYEVTVGNLRAEPALTCDFCGCDTQDPWHGSTATNRHVHACDMCRPKLAQPQGEPVAWINPAGTYTDWRKGNEHE